VFEASRAQLEFHLCLLARRIPALRAFIGDDAFYRAISRRKVFAARGEQIRLGIQEALFSNSEELRQMVARMHLSPRCALPSTEFIEAIAAQIVRRMETARLRDSCDILDTWASQSRRRMNAIWKFHLGFAIAIVVIMLLLLATGAVVGFARDQPAWGLAIGGLGLGEFLSLIWIPFRKIEVINGKLTQLDFVVTTCCEKWRAAGRDQRGKHIALTRSVVVADALREMKALFRA
jgi:hypothetical protein